MADEPETRDPPSPARKGAEPKAGSGHSAEREERLAAALRANLRRRKGVPPKGP